MSSFSPSPARALIAPGRRVYPSSMPVGMTTSSLSLLPPSPILAIPLSTGGEYAGIVAVLAATGVVSAD